MERRGQSHDSLEAEGAGLPAVQAVARLREVGMKGGCGVWSEVEGRKPQLRAAAQASPLPRPSANTLSAPRVSR